MHYKKLGLAKWLQDEIVSGNYMLLKNIILLQYYCYKMKLNETLSFSFLLFLWDNASQKRQNTFAICEVQTANFHSGKAVIFA